MIARLRTSDLRVRLVVCSDVAHVDAEAKFAAMMPRGALLSVLPLAERKEEIPRLFAAYSAEAAAEPRVTFEGFRSGDLDRVQAAGIATMASIEDAARRLVALRSWGVTGGARRLGITHGRCLVGHVGGSSRRDERVRFATASRAFIAIERDHSVSLCALECGGIGPVRCALVALSKGEHA